jgi:glutamine cyclotransferase
MLGSACTPPEPTASADVVFYTYAVLGEYPHDSTAFTQGLVIDNGVLYEGTGLHGKSSLRRVVIETGDVTQIATLPEAYFGEGITVFDDRIIQLTWRSNIAFVYDRDSFELIDEFTYDTEGWGLTHDGDALIMSDGTSLLYFLDPKTYEEIRTVDVRDAGVPVTELNELEYIDGEVYANVWKTNRIARIDPQTGKVIGWVDLSGLLSAELQQGADVLNGIAYDHEDGRLFVTGKLWPRLFEITVIPLR